MTAATVVSTSHHAEPATEHQSVWHNVQELLKQQMTRPGFETWISPLAMGRLFKKPDKTVIHLDANSAFNRDWVMKHYRRQLTDAFTSILDRPAEIHIDVCEAPVEETPDDDPARTEKDEWRPWTPRSNRYNLNPRYTFENFVVGQHNRFCHAAALAVAETPAQSYNPFFIYGGVGLGKTHLMQAIGHFALMHHNDLKVRYVTAEQFTNDLITALGTKAMNSFRDRYRKIDILIIDDIQFLEGKERTQEEVFHTFNALHGAGKQIILSSDRSPRELSRLEDRLKSRFEWGLIADIQPPDYETRLAILQKKAEREHIDMPTEVLEYVADAYPNNIRELEGALNKVAAYAMLTKTLMDLDTAKNVLGTPVDRTNISIARIIDATAAYYHLRGGDLKSPSRAKDVSHARQVSIYLARTMTEASFPKIGEALGGRKHTTILYAFEKIKDELDRHPVLKQQIAEITGRIKSGL